MYIWPISNWFCHKQLFFVYFPSFLALRFLQYFNNALHKSIPKVSSSSAHFWESYGQLCDPYHILWLCHKICFEVYFPRLFPLRFLQQSSNAIYTSNVKVSSSSEHFWQSYGYLCLAHFQGTFFCDTNIVTKYWKWYTSPASLLLIVYKALVL